MSAWKTTVCQKGHPLYPELQWGHADVGVEDRDDVADPLEEVKASMGPRRCRRGRPRSSRPEAPEAWRLQWGHADVGVEDNQGQSANGTHVLASMGPRRCRRGRRRRTDRDGGRGAASMGPRRCRRGRRGVCPHTWRSCDRFNGATPMSAWKTRPKSTDGGDQLAASMGPRRCRRGRRGRSGIGATICNASMGPRRCRRGRHGTAVSLGPAIWQLQWGHADVGVEDGSCRPRPAPRPSLQWGHADVGVEDPLRRTRQGRLGPASMGPRRCRRGRPVAGGSSPATGGSLQWGHADVGVEDDKPPSSHEASRYRFNGATPMSAWKTHPCLAPYRGHLHASMGPRRCRRGRRQATC